MSLYLVKFISIKQDNKNIHNFKPRKEFFLTDKDKNSNFLLDQFNYFVKRGKPNETCRYYYSVNARNIDLLDLTKLQSLNISQIVKSNKFAATNHYLINIDQDDIKPTLNYLVNEDETLINNPLKIIRTKNHFAIITDHPFDPTKLINKFSAISIDKDGWQYIIAKSNINKTNQISNTNKYYLSKDFSMNNIAKHIIGLANSHDLFLNNDQLENVMYFIFYKIIQKNIDNPKFYRLIRAYKKQPFLVYRQGPVISSIYNKYKIFGNSSILEHYHELDSLKYFNQDIIKLIKTDQDILIEKALDEKFWLDNIQYIRNGKSNVAYPFDMFKFK